MIALLHRSGTPDRDRARAMLEAAPHRGSQFTFRTIGTCLLGVATRPALACESLSGEGPVVAAMTGRIDNADDVYRRLLEADTPPASRADADLICASVRAFGAEAPNGFRGSFAAIVSDGSTVWCFRDHIGFQPLFYHARPDGFVAASEPRQVQVGAGLPLEPDMQVLEDIFYGLLPSDMPAALRGVARLPQGSTLVATSEGSPAVHRYWHPDDLLETADPAPDQVLEQFADLMTQAVSRSLGEKTAVMLSGGVDSPAVAAFGAPEMQRRFGGTLGAISTVFPDLPAVDERPHIERVVEALGLDWHTYRPEARALDDVAEWSRRCGGPIPILSLPEVADSNARARGLGYTTVLTGEFAEFCIGSPTHAPSHLLARGRWDALRRVWAAERQRGVTRTRLVRQLLATVVPGPAFTRYFRLRRLDVRNRIPDWVDVHQANRVSFRDDLLPPGPDRWRTRQLAGTHGCTITMEAYELTALMAGVTVRRPFADVDLWEFFLSLPAETKFPDLRYKTLLRRCLRGWVPDAILDRRDKTLFNDHVMAQIDYDTLNRLLRDPSHRLAGVDYGRLASHLRDRDMTQLDWAWARDLARVHAFLGTV